MLELLDLFKEKPAEMGVVQHEVLLAVAQVEKDSDGKSGFEKEAEALKLAYDAIDMLVNFPGAVDHIVKSMVIPHIPQLIKWAVDEFNKLGWPE